MHNEDPGFAGLAVLALVVLGVGWLCVVVLFN